MAELFVSEPIVIDGLEQLDWTKHLTRHAGAPTLFTRSLCLSLQGMHRAIRDTAEQRHPVFPLFFNDDHRWCST